MGYNNPTKPYQEPPRLEVSLMGQFGELRAQTPARSWYPADVKRMLHGMPWASMSSEDGWHYEVLYVNALTAAELHNKFRSSFLTTISMREKLVARYSADGVDQSVEFHAQLAEDAKRQLAALESIVHDASDEDLKVRLTIVHSPPEYR